jgi:transposase
MAMKPIKESIKMRMLLDEIDGNLFSNDNLNTNPYSIVTDIPTEILEDNRSAIDWSKHNANSTKMKHLERDLKWIQQHVERKQIKLIHMPTHKSKDYKETAVNYYLVEDKTQEKVCKIFKCSPRSLMRWVERYKKDGNVDIHYRKPVAYKVKKEYVKFLLDELQKNKTSTLQELNQKLKDKFKGVDLSTTQIFRVIKDNNISLKLTRIRHEPTMRFGKEININHKIKDFYEEVKKYKIEDIICIDETSIKSLQKRNHCYSRKGKRCIIKTQSQEVFKKYTGIFAISIDGVIDWDLYEK